MGLPNLKDLVLAFNRAITAIDWNTNWQKIVNWLTDGKTDLKVKSIELSSNGGITNNGSLTQSGNFTVSGNTQIDGNLNVDGVLSGDGSGLTGVVSSATVVYTPFCVNSGNLDANGDGDLFRYTANVSTSIEFKVDDGTSYKPITFTFANGKTTTLNAINSYDLSQTLNGTYIVYLEENATAVTLTSAGAKRSYQPVAPTSPNPTDIWLDTSVEGLKSKIMESGSWQEKNFVMLGSVTVVNNKISSAKTFSFNQNTYNINGRSALTVGVSSKAISSLVSGTIGTSYFASAPTLVTVGYASESAAPDYGGSWWYLYVSTDNSTWVKLAGHSIANGDPKSAILQSLIINTGLYFKVEKGGAGVPNVYNYAPIWGYDNNY